MKKTIYLFCLTALFSCSNAKKEADKVFKDGVNAYASGDLNKAIGAFTQSITLNPDMHAAYYNRGTVYIVMKKFDLALADFNQCLHIKPGYYLAQYQSGIALQNLKDYPAAIERYSNAIKHDPMFKDAFFNRAWTYLDMQDTSRACQDFQTCYDMGMTDVQKFLVKFCNRYGS